MLHFRSSNGPEIFVADGCDELHAVCAISNWLRDRCSHQSFHVADKLQRIVVQPESVVIHINDAPLSDRVETFAQQMLGDHVDGWFAHHRMGYAVGLCGEVVLLKLEDDWHTVGPITETPNPMKNGPTSI